MINDPFPEIYDDYARCVRLALTSIGRTWRAAALEYENLLDAEWNRMSRVMPPRQSLGRARFPRHHLHPSLHTVGHQAAFPDTSLIQDFDAFSLSVRP